MSRSTRSNFLPLLSKASILLSCLAAIPGYLYGQTSAASAPAAFRVAANPTGLHYAANGAAPIVPTSQELRTFELVNAERARYGLRPLVWDAELTRMARLHSENMARQNFFNHQAPDGQGLRERSRASGIVGYKRLGENLAYNKGFADAASCAVVGWMRSEGHREHILDGEFTRAGLGIARSADGRVYFTQDFAVH